jgi:hypothetical protein
MIKKLKVHTQASNEISPKTHDYPITANQQKTDNITSSNHPATRKIQSPKNTQGYNRPQSTITNFHTKNQQTLTTI